MSGYPASCSVPGTRVRPLPLGTTRHRGLGYILGYISTPVAPLARITYNGVALGRIVCGHRDAAADRLPAGKM